MISVPPSTETFPFGETEFIIEKLYVILNSKVSTPFVITAVFSPTFSCKVYEKLPSPAFSIGISFIVSGKSALQTPVKTIDGSFTVILLSVGDVITSVFSSAATS